eukprot:CAMPEP_0205999288 /NCGR_PEP_ID=MMETSP1464-20131121/759_1 /ASSEMBLY_ACC=CAM_ASM_001124 /TAXON_ID=119497 /ORGANISM="Exanthemachrysis gayraliae, Strain RCC1523" /LENGTH=290 /DNA_ID=CAMNT_0053372479 /DNA_START=161 /DNA_END=1030 /DNA_ORIENTATION=-
MTGLAPGPRCPRRGGRGPGGGGRAAAAAPAGRERAAAAAPGASCGASGAPGAGGRGCAAAAASCASCVAGAPRARRRAAAASSSSPCALHGAGGRGCAAAAASRGRASGGTGGQGPCAPGPSAPGAASRAADATGAQPRRANDPAQARFAALDHLTPVQCAGLGLASLPAWTAPPAFLRSEYAAANQVVFDAAASVADYSSVDGERALKMTLIFNSLLLRSTAHGGRRGAAALARRMQLFLDGDYSTLVSEWEREGAAKAAARQAHRAAPSSARRTRSGSAGGSVSKGRL